MTSTTQLLPLTGWQGRRLYPMAILRHALTETKSNRQAYRPVSFFLIGRQREMLETSVMIVRSDSCLGGGENHRDIQAAGA